MPAEDVARLGQHRTRPRRVTNGKVRAREPHQAEHGERPLTGQLRSQGDHGFKLPPGERNIAATHGKPDEHATRDGGGGEPPDLFTD